MSYLSEFIAGHYDARPEDEWERLERHRTELAVTLCTIEAHFPPAPARVLDCGGGPGRYAVELARRGYQVTLFDLSAGNLRLARERAVEAGVELAAYEQGTATDLSRFPDGSFDAVLLLGPLYHLLEAAERRVALAEAQRVLRPGGILLAALISRYAAHRYAARDDPEWILRASELAQGVLESGCLPPREEGAFVAYMAHPDEVAPLCWQAGLEVLAVLGVEGLVSMIETAVNALSGEAWERWVELNTRLAVDPSLHGCVEHLLVVTRKPRWRTVLRDIAVRLEQAGLDYKLVGSACVALHGVPLTVQDLDLETNIEDAYRFQALFPEQVIQPVDWRQGRIYRSFFGRFDFEGVEVEVMGELQRRDGERWAPTMTQTESHIDVDGTLVRVSWLEEETLAYIRRGRLERAALCLVHCDRERLLALVRGEQGTQVI